MSKPDESSGLNAEDLALVAKYKAQIDEATKKYKETRATDAGSRSLCPGLVEPQARL